MNRNWIITLILFFIVLPGIVWAQNVVLTMVDVQWVYDEMESLYREGLLNNYPYEWVRSGNKLDRLEIAHYIKQLIINKLDSSQWQGKAESVFESIQKLVVEFREELTALGVKITDIYKISPNMEKMVIPNDGYQDLDVILSNTGKNVTQQESYYYFGQYIEGVFRKSFLFIPVTLVKGDSYSLFQGADGKINIVYHPEKIENPPFLVVKGDLPLDSKKIIAGYYLFPLEGEREKIAKDSPVLGPNVNNSALDVLDGVNQVLQIENLWRFNGVLPLKGYLKIETDLQNQVLSEDSNKGLKIGGLLISTDNHAESKLMDFGLPFFSSRQQPVVVDLDKINHDELQSVQINIQGNMALSSKTLITGELGLLYRGYKSGWEALCPSDTKAGAGIQYQFNDYWSVLSYQSFVNSQLELGLLSTTSVGVEYNKWITLWLAYQILSFDDSKVTGALTFRF